MTQRAAGVAPPIGGIMFCRQCGTQNDPTSLFCGKCGAAMSVAAAHAETGSLASAGGVPSSPRSSPAVSVSLPIPPSFAPISSTPPKATTQPLVEDYVLAAIGDRAIAALLDSIVIAILIIPVGMWAAVRWGGVTPNGFELQGTAAFFTFFMIGIFWLLYYWLFEGMFGTTLGKLIMQVKVQRLDGSNLGLGKSLIRNSLRVVDGIGLYLVGFLVALLSSKRQRLGDHVAGTFVIRSNAAKAARVAATVALVAIIATCFVAAYKLHATVPRNVIVQPTAAPSQATAPGSAVGAQPRVTRAEMGTDSTEDYKIIGPSAEFYTDTPQIVCVWEIAGTDPSAPLKSVWIAEDVGDVAPPNYQLAEKSMSGVNEGKFYVTQPTNGWPAGKYRLEIYIGGNLAKQIPFTIKQR
jgi:uncharacterized RDD family membrane protein YckC